MPELPEVQEVRRTLEPHVLGKTITAIRVLRPDFITPKNAPLDNLLHHHISTTHRHGKKLFLVANPDPCAPNSSPPQYFQTLLLHLGMTGRVDCLPADAPIAKHTHLILTLNTGTTVRFRDPRRFGGIWYYPTLDDALAAETANLGPDALELLPQHLAHWLAKKSPGRLKQRLLAQRDVAGLGNIYVDEALWQAQLHPLQRVSRLKPGQIQLLVVIIRKLLRRSIALGGTTLRDYRNVADQPGRFVKLLQAYGRAGLPCFRCQTALASATIAGRTTVFCPNCQRRH